MTFQCGWYWGPLGWENAEAKLEDKPDGSFLVRDSSDDRYILSLSFRSQNVTHHTRIEHYKGKPDCHKTWTLFFVWMLVSTLMHCAVCSIQMTFLLCIFTIEFLIVQSWNISDNAALYFVSCFASLFVCTLRGWVLTSRS